MSTSTVTFCHGACVGVVPVLVLVPPPPVVPLWLVVVAGGEPADVVLLRTADSAQNIPSSAMARPISVRTRGNDRPATAQGYTVRLQPPRKPVVEMVALVAG